MKIPKMDIKTIKNLAVLGPMRAAIAAANYEAEIVRVMTALSGKYRIEQVNAAINASGASPYTIYMLLAANDRTVVLERFYEALNGPGGNEK